MRRSLHRVGFGQLAEVVDFTIGDQRDGARDHGLAARSTGVQDTESAMRKAAALGDEGAGIVRSSVDEHFGHGFEMQVGTLWSRVTQSNIAKDSTHDGIVALWPCRGAGAPCSVEQWAGDRTGELFLMRRIAQVIDEFEVGLVRLTTVFGWLCRGVFYEFTKKAIDLRFQYRGGYPRGHGAMFGLLQSAFEQGERDDGKCQARRTVGGSRTHDFPSGLHVAGLEVGECPFSSNARTACAASGPDRVRDLQGGSRPICFSRNAYPLARKVTGGRRPACCFIEVGE